MPRPPSPPSTTCLPRRWGERSDLLCRLTVRMVEKGLPPEGVMGELNRRSAKTGNLKQLHQTDKES